ncbi:IclR family transcriptional regulator [Streptomyces sp. NBC_01231]|nr:IclR family transcriptional regulator [Streptomyces sp. NBC_01231]
MSKPMKSPPVYAPTSVDHALRLAQILQMEGVITVSAAAARLGVARSTAHRLLSALAYRDFALQDEDRSYRAGPILELAGQSRSNVGALRAAALDPMRALVDRLNETVNLSIRTGRNARFIASVECSQALRVGSREGMVFPAHLVCGGLITLAALSNDELEALYAPGPTGGHDDNPPNLTALCRELREVRDSGVALNVERSERGVVAVGCRLTDRDDVVVAGLSISMPSIRYSPTLVRPLLRSLRSTADVISRSL